MINKFLACMCNNTEGQPPARHKIINSMNDFFVTNFKREVNISNIRIDGSCRNSNFRFAMGGYSIKNLPFKIIVEDWKTSVHHHDHKKSLLR